MIVCWLTDGTPSTFDTPDTRINSTPARADEKAEGIRDTVVTEGPTHNPEPDTDKCKLYFAYLKLIEVLLFGISTIRQND